MDRFRNGWILVCVLLAGCGGIRAKRETVVHRSAVALLHPGRFGAGSKVHPWSQSLIAARDEARRAATVSAAPSISNASSAIADHNDAVERLVRLAWGRGDGLNALRVFAALGITVNSANEQLDPARIEHLEIAADYKVTGLSHHFQAEGLGVPVVVRRRNALEDRRTTLDQYFPEQVVANATAVYHPGSSAGGGDTLTLHDPFEESSVTLADGRSLPLAGDRTAALAVQVERDRSLRGAAFGGAVNANLRKYEERLALLRPHHPGRIPVVFVHGLASSPLIWAETINELGNDPTLSDRYEFWFFLYASGEPIPLSAAKLREEIAAARADFDPTGSDPALQKMVVVGHSQGGLLSKTLVQDSGLTLWNEALHIPHPATLLTPATQASLERALIFERDPHIRRMVFIATPHQGSPVADNPLARVLSLVSRAESSVARDTREIRRAYGRDRIQGGLRGDALGLNNLRPSSSVLAALNQIPLDPAVPHHTISLQLNHFNPNGGDGLVPYDSSHLKTAASEVIVPGFHLDIDEPGVTDELRRILRLHLAEEPVSGVEIINSKLAPAR